MDKQSLRIVFMGTPEFAVETLRLLVEEGYQVVGVVTMPDKPIGRHGSVLQSSAVKQYAVEVGLPVLQPEKLKDPAFLTALRDLKADLQIVVAFRMLPEVVWSMPPYGTFNLHASLLPQYRGAAPINWAIINGEQETGVTTFFLTHDIDTGPLLMQKRLPITEDDDAGTIHDALMSMGASLVGETVDRILADGPEVKRVSQSVLIKEVGELRDAPKIFKDSCRIPWLQPGRRVYDFIRGLSPYPGAWCNVIMEEGQRQITMKIFHAVWCEERHTLPLGSLRVEGKKSIEVALEDGFLRLLTVQLAGKKKMTAQELLNGNRLEGAMVIVED